MGAQKNKESYGRVRTLEIKETLILNMLLNEYIKF